MTIPSGVAVFPKEIVTPVRKWMEASYTNIQHWSEMPKGGHFAAFEQPELFVREVRDFFRTLALNRLFRDQFGPVTAQFRRIPATVDGN